MIKNVHPVDFRKQEYFFDLINLFLLDHLSSLTDLRLLLSVYG